MPFNNDKAIYLQIADRLSDEILAGTYKAFDRIPSVREYASQLGVNANTAVKAYDQLGMSDMRDDSERIMRKNFPNSVYYTRGLEREVPWWKLW